MSVDIRDKLRPMPKHGSILLYVHANHMTRYLTQLLNYVVMVLMTLPTRFYSAAFTKSRLCQVKLWHSCNDLARDQVTNHRRFSAPKVYFTGMSSRQTLTNQSIRPQCFSGCLTLRRCVCVCVCDCACVCLSLRARVYLCMELDERKSDFSIV